MVTNLQSQLLDGSAVRLTWESDRPVHRVFVNGLLAITTPATSYTLQLSAGQLADVQVVDDEDGDPGEAWPAWILLQWFTGGLAAASYRVEQQAGADWLLRGIVPHAAHTYLTWRSADLADDTSHTFRVVPVSSAGNAGAPRPVSVLMVRRPDPPDPSFSYDADTGVVTIQ